MFYIIFLLEYIIWQITDPTDKEMQMCGSECSDRQTEITGQITKENMLPPPLFN